MTATKETAQQAAIANKTRQFEFNGKKYNTLTGKEVKASTQKFLAISHEFHAYVCEDKTGVCDTNNITIKEFGDSIMAYFKQEGIEKLTPYFEKQIAARVAITRNRASREEIEQKAAAEATAAAEAAAELKTIEARDTLLATLIKSGLTQSQIFATIKATFPAHALTTSQINSAMKKAAK